MSSLPARKTRAAATSISFIDGSCVSGLACSEQFEQPMKFGVGVVEVRRQADVMAARTVGAQGGDDVSFEQFLVKRGRVGPGQVNGDDGAGVGGRGGGLRYGPALGLRRR